MSKYLRYIKCVLPLLFMTSSVRANLFDNAQQQEIRIVKNPNIQPTINIAQPESLGSMYCSLWLYRK